MPPMLTTANLSNDEPRRMNTQEPLMRTKSVVFQDQPNIIIDQEPTTQKPLKNVLKEGSFQLNTLRFDSLGLHGRDYEIRQLREALQRVRRSSALIGGGKEIVLITGNSGCGKTSLAMELKEPTNQAGGFFVSGKFDLQQSNEPYSAFSSAFESLCEKIIESGNTELRDSINNALGSEGVYLSNIIPNIGKLFDDTSEDTRSEITRPKRESSRLRGRNRNSLRSSLEKVPSMSLAGPEYRNKLNYLMRLFIQAVSSPSRPLVVLIDDLQWIDSSSLDLMEHILMDPKTCGLLLLGCYRDNEVGESHPLSRRIRLMKETATNVANLGALYISNLFVENLSHKVISLMLEDLLCASQGETEELAEVVFQKTQGNAFFVVEFLRALNTSGLLTYNLGLMRWRWQIDEIRSRTHVTKNVAAFVTQGMENSLSRSAKRLLPLVACLGHAFDEKIVELVVSKLEDIRQTELGFVTSKVERIDLEKALNDCVEKRVLERETVTKRNQESQLETMTCYRFAHDQIQQAALSLQQNEELITTQSLIGKLLIENLDDSGYERFLFVAVDLLNRGIGHTLLYGDKASDFDHAHLNLLAGRKAKGLSAFMQSADYFKTGIGILDQAIWGEIEHVHLFVRLHSNAAEVAYCVGNFTSMQQHVEAVLNRTDVCFDDKIRIYTILTQALRAQGKSEESIETSALVLSEVEYELPKRYLKLSVFKNLFKTKKALAGKTNKDLLALHTTNDESKVMITKIFDGLTISTYVARPDLFPIVICKGFQWILEHGLNRHAPALIACYGVLLCAMGDIVGGNKMSQFAMELVERPGYLDVKSRVVFIYHTFVAHWMTPMSMSMKAVMDGYHLGMRTGDVEHAFLNITMYFSCSVNVGRNLSLLEEEMRLYIGEMIQYQQDIPYLNGVVSWQFVLNMMGKSEDPTKLVGEAMDQDKLMKQLEETNNTQMMDLTRHARLMLLYYFGKYDLAWEMVILLRNFEKTNASHSMLWRKLMFQALTCFAFARQKKSRRWRQRGSKITKRMKNWILLGNLNCVHVVPFLEAEEASLKGENDEAFEKYTQAITASGRAGFINDKALINERVGEFLLSHNNLEDASFHLNIALQHYIKWGAMAKAHHLRSKYMKVLRQSQRHLIESRSPQTSWWEYINRIIPFR